MESILRSRGLWILQALSQNVTTTACQSSPDRDTREVTLTQALETLMPNGRVYANDLAANGPVEVRNAWLFDNEIILEGMAGDITALSRGNLGAMWYYDRLPGPLDQEPSASAFSFLFVSDGVLYEVERKLGNQVRGGIPLNFVPSASPAARAPPAISPVLGADGGPPTIITVNLSTGLEGWRVATRSSVMTSVVSGGSTTRPMIYFAEEKASVYAYAADSSASGAPGHAWATLTYGLNKHAPVALEDLVLLGSDEGDFWALDRVTGTVNWSVMSGSPLLDSPWASGDQVYFTNGRGFHCHAREDGQHLWSYERPGQFLVRRTDAVYLYVGRGTVHALDVTNGKLLRTVNFGEGVRFLTNMADGNFYAVTQNGFVFMVDLGIQ